MRNKIFSFVTVLAVGLSIAAPAAARGPKPEPHPEPASMTLTLTCHLKDLGSHDWFPGDPPFPHLDASLAFVGFGKANYTVRIDVGDIVDEVRQPPTAAYWTTWFRVPAGGEFPDPVRGDVLYLDFSVESGDQYWGVATLGKGRKRVAIADVEITC